MQNPPPPYDVYNIPWKKNVGLMKLKESGVFNPYEPSLPFLGP